MPAWSALTMHVPIPRNVSVPPLTVHTPGVDELKLTASPDVALAPSVRLVPIVCGPGLAKLIDCVATHPENPPVYPDKPHVARPLAVPTYPGAQVAEQLVPNVVVPPQAPVIT